MKKQYIPQTLQAALGFLVEECGEVQAATGKSIRWGLESTNPELPESERETNRDWILRELKDLDNAIYLARRFLRETAPPAVELAASETRS